MVLRCITTICARAASTPSTKWTALQQGFEHKTSIIDFVQASGKFLVMTEVDAPNYRLVEVGPANPAKEN